MLAYRTFLDTVASVVCTLDAIHQCDALVMVDSMHTAAVTSGDAWEVLQKMERGGLVAFEGDDLYQGRIVAITPKGRYLAADIRELAALAEQVRP